VAQREAQQKQAPAVGDLDKARKQGDDLHTQLNQAAEQLKTSQERVAQLEAQQKQAPAVGDLNKARKQGEELYSDTTEVVERGDRLLLVADVASARLHYERAATKGNALAALRLGQTYARQILDRVGLRGIQSNPESAVYWYRLARDLGNDQAA